uniref:Secreted protein n=1 Tax=Opuntia streptacantha TaxID=393608 RepID=A0A7C8YDT6_OPUST
MFLFLAADLLFGWLKARPTFVVPLSSGLSQRLRRTMRIIRMARAMAITTPATMATIGIGFPELDDTGWSGGEASPSDSDGGAGSGDSGGGVGEDGGGSDVDEVCTLGEHLSIADPHSSLLPAKTLESNLARLSGTDPSN